MTKMDMWNLKILYELDKNGRVTYNQIARKIGKSKSFVQYRIENLFKKGIVIDYVVIADTSKIGFQTYDIYLKIIEENSKEVEIISYLFKKSEINCIQKIIGKYQLYISIFTKNIIELENFFQELLSRFREIISEYDILLIYKAYSPSHNYLFNNNFPNLNQTKPLLCSEKLELNDIEINILKEIEKNPRISLFEISKKINSSLTTIKKNHKNLFEKEIIYYIRPSINQNTLGYINKHFLFKFKTIGILKIEEIKKFLLSLDSTLFLSYAFGKYDLTGDFVFEDLKEFRNFQENLFKKFPDCIEFIDFFDYFEEIKYSHIPYDKI